MKKIFSTKKYLEDMIKFNLYGLKQSILMGNTWFIENDGKEVIDGFVSYYPVVDEWCEVIE